MIDSMEQEDFDIRNQQPSPAENVISRTLSVR